MHILFWRALNRSPIARYICAVLFTVLGINCAFAGDGYLPGGMEPRQVKLLVSGGELIDLRAKPATVFIADPSIADVQLPVPDKVFIYGKKPGRTAFFALGADGKKIDNFDVIVTYNTSDLKRYLSSELGDLPIKVQETPRGLVLMGVVPNAATAELVKSTTIRLVGEGTPVINNLRVSGSMQVSLHVRVAEVSRSVTKELGINWSAVGNAGNITFGVATGALVKETAAVIKQAVGQTGALAQKTSINSLIDALVGRDLVTILAEPNLVAVSGEKASFLAGGEFPVPISQSATNSISVEFRKFGVSLEFTPTVLSDRLINLVVKPEVSDISSNGAVVLNGFSIPSLTTRRAETTIEMGSGESLVIGGLMQNRSATSVSSLPGIEDVPLLSALFRSSRFQKSESELLIIVTPYIVRPVADAAAIKIPNDAVVPATDRERVFEGRLVKKGTGKDAGPAKWGGSIQTEATSGFGKIDAPSKN